MLTDNPHLQTYCSLLYLALVPNTCEFFVLLIYHLHKRPALAKWNSYLYTLICVLIPLLSLYANPPSMLNTLPMGSMTQCQSRNYVFLQGRQYNPLVQLFLQRKCVDASARLKTTVLM